MLFDRCCRSIGIRCGGIATSRIPASDLGVPTDEFGSDSGDCAADADNPVTKIDVFSAQFDEFAPTLSPHHAASSVIGRSRSGMAATNKASSARSGVVILWTRLLLPAPLMWQGFALISSSWTAVARMERSSE